MGSRLREMASKAIDSQDVESHNHATHQCELLTSGKGVVAVVDVDGECVQRDEAEPEDADGEGVEGAGALHQHVAQREHEGVGEGEAKAKEGPAEYDALQSQCQHS